MDCSTETCTRVKTWRSGFRVTNSPLLSTNTVDLFPFCFSFDLFLVLLSSFAVGFLVACLFFLRKVWAWLKVLGILECFGGYDIIYILHMGCLNKKPLYDKPRFTYLLTFLRHHLVRMPPVHSVSFPSLSCIHLLVGTLSAYSSAPATHNSSVITSPWNGK